MYELLTKLYPICRSLTGNGNRETLRILRDYIGAFSIHEIASGTKVFDWTVPDEWNCKEAWLSGPNHDLVCDFKQNNLHVVGYSHFINEHMGFGHVHLHTLRDRPNAIPYVTSYYKRDWGFCISYNRLQSLADGIYRVCIDATLEPGYLTYGDVVIRGDSKDEVLLATYICHPSMANDNLSGPVVAAHLAKYLLCLPQRRYTYRFVFVPETIGAIVYLAAHLQHLKSRVVAGYQLTCLGDNRTWSFLPSRKDHTLPDEIADHVMWMTHIHPKVYPWTLRGSDERQWCAPGVDLPVCSVMRSKYGSFPEYHTSDDNLDFVTAEVLEESFNFYKRVIECLEANYGYRATCLGEPFLSKYGLYKSASTDSPDVLMNILTYADGRSLLEIAKELNEPMWKLAPHIATLEQHSLVKRV